MSNDLVQQTDATLKAGPSRQAGNNSRLALVAAGILVLCFAKPLYALLRLALTSELYNYILLVPAVSAYFAWAQKGNLTPTARPFRKLALLPGVAGLAFAVAYWLAPLTAPAEDALFLSTLSFLCLLVASFLFFVGRDTVARLAFPLGFLFAAVPIPVAARDAVEVFLQHGSAALANALFALSNTTVLHDGLSFRFAGFSLFVAPECSGIRSTLVLLVTSIVAAQVFLERPLNRVVLCLVVIPLGILRNALRIFTLAQLSIHISPEILNSFIHRRGGPFFFAAALVPFFVLLWALRHFEQRRRAPRPTGAPALS